MGQLQLMLSGAVTEVSICLEHVIVSRTPTYDPIQSSLILSMVGSDSESLSKYELRSKLNATGTKSAVSHFQRSRLRLDSSAAL